MESLDVALGPRVRLLDPRPALEAHAQPILDAVNIPLAELPDRTHELPSRESVVAVAAFDETADLTVGWLKAHGRRAGTTTDWKPGGTPRGRLWEPNAFLTECLPHLAPGNALDLGCGSGRDAVALASLGWTVTAVDRLPDALDKGRDLAARHLGDGASRIAWIGAELEPDLPRLHGPYDVVTAFFYYREGLVARMIELLAPNGSLLIEAFSRTHLERTGKPARNRVTDPAELATLFEGLEILRCDEGQRPDRHTVRAWARRRP